MTAYRELVAATGSALQDSLDVDFSMKGKLDMAMVMDMPELGESMQEEIAADVTVDGTIQMIMDPEDIKLGAELDMVINMEMDDPETGAAMNVSQPMSMGVWMKDNWMYVSDGTTSYKQDMSETMGEFMTAYEELMGYATEMTDVSVAMMMPYIDGITATRSGSNTIYTLDINDAAYNGLLSDIFDLIFSMVDSQMATETGMNLSMTLDKYDCSYTVGRTGLKKMDADMTFTLAMGVNDPISGNMNISANADVEMDMTVNTTGNSVRVDYPNNLNTFRDYEEILAEMPEQVPSIDDSALS